jgi:hypothetical protein
MPSDGPVAAYRDIEAARLDHAEESTTAYPGILDARAVLRARVGSLEPSHGEPLPAKSPSRVLPTPQKFRYALTQNFGRARYRFV